MEIVNFCSKLNFFNFGILLIFEQAFGGFYLVFASDTHVSVEFEGEVFVFGVEVLHNSLCVLLVAR